MVSPPSMHRRHAPALLSLAVVLLTAASCGGSDSSPTPSSPTPTPTPGGSSGATITITASGVSPRALTVAAGSRVTFVNNDSRLHEMNSDPHPDHTDCPAINDVGFLQPGQSRQTGNLNTPRTCRYHDHNRDSDPSLQGSITIQ
jgi:plastocyanin